MVPASGEVDVRPVLPVMKRSLVTSNTLAEDLCANGIEYGDTVLVHTGLSKLGFVPGAAQSIIAGLLKAVGSEGTIAMPTFSGEHSDPAEWRYPPVPKDWIEQIRAEMPGYDPSLTPTRKMGVVAEYFRNFPGVLRSPHPQSSISALGRNADTLVSTHPIDFRFGPLSPLGTLLNLKGKVLLLGAPPQTCSFFYLSQHQMPNNQEVKKRAPIAENGKSEWIPYTDIQYPNNWFNDAMRMLLDKGLARKFRIGEADCYLFETALVFPTVVEWRLSVL